MRKHDDLAFFRGLPMAIGLSLLLYAGALYVGWKLAKLFF